MTKLCFLLFELELFTLSLSDILVGELCKLFLTQSFPDIADPGRSGFDEVFAFSSSESDISPSSSSSSWLTMNGKLTEGPISPIVRGEADLTLSCPGMTGVDIFDAGLGDRDSALEELWRRRLEEDGEGVLWGEDGLWEAWLAGVDGEGWLMLIAVGEGFLKNWPRPQSSLDVCKKSINLEIFCKIKNYYTFSFKLFKLFIYSFTN